MKFQTNKFYFTIFYIAECLMSDKKQLVRLPANVSYRRVTVNIKLTAKEKFLINEQLFIIGFENSQTNQTEIILGDLIAKLNGRRIKTRAEAISTLSTPGEMSFELVRRKFSKPVPRERFSSVIKIGDLGFSYFVIECVKEVSDTTTSMGFTLKVLKNRAYIIGVEPRSIASRFFSIGDALCDLDSVPIPMNDTEFIKKYAPHFFKQGRFTAVVERAVHPEALRIANCFFKLLIPQVEDVEMATDAIEIGRQAAIMHKSVFRKLTPRSVLSNDSLKANKEKTVESTITTEDSTKRVKVVPRTLITTIGSDADENDSLRHVKKKSHASDDGAYDHYDDY